jgi:hypothetical protein
MTVSNVENFLTQLGKNQTGHSLLLFRRACLELCALMHNNKSDTARTGRMNRLCPDAFASDASCRMSLTKWAKRQDMLADLKFEDYLEYYLTTGSVQSTLAIQISQIRFLRQSVLKLDSSRSKAAIRSA